MALLACSVWEALAGDADTEQRQTAQPSSWIKQTNPASLCFRIPGRAHGQNSIIRADGFQTVCHQLHKG